MVPAGHDRSPGCVGGGAADLGPMLPATPMGKWVDRFAELLWPGTAVLLALDRISGSGLGSRFWWCLGISHALGWAALWVAQLRMGRIWREAARTSRSGVLGTLRAWYRCRVLQRNPASRHAWLERAPYAWRVLRTRVQEVGAWLGTVAAFVTVVIAGSRFALTWEEIQHVGLRVTSLWLKVSVAVGSVGGLMRDRQSRALELLAVTPLGIAGVWRQHLRGLLEIYRWPVGMVALFALTSSLVFDSLRYFYVAVFAVCDAVSLAFLGTCLALECRSMAQAVGTALVIVLILPWAALSWSVGGPVHPDFVFVLSGLVVDIAAPLWSWRYLTHKAQEMGARP